MCVCPGYTPTVLKLQSWNFGFIIPSTQPVTGNKKFFDRSSLKIFDFWSTSWHFFHILFFIFISASFFVPWEKVFNVSVAFSHELKLLLPIVFGLFCSQLALRLITTIYVADQKNSFQDLIHCIINVVSLLVIWIMSKFQTINAPHL